jgi:hypothetical protein
VTFSFDKLWEQLRFFYGLTHRAESIYAILAKQYRERVLAAEKASDPKTITAYGFSGYSQSDEDGILEEIYRRIGTTNRTFVGFGCNTGVENDSVYLLLTGWTGLWMDASEANIQNVRRLYPDHLKSGVLKLKQAFINRENINGLIAEAQLPREMDLLHIDIDGNDYWVWEAINIISPRVVLIEYNATFRPPVAIVQKYDPNYRANFSNYYGASLKALELLGRRKGYSLVGCSFTGVNAFFVRDDLMGDLFSAPYTAEHHFREANYDSFVRGYRSHRKDIGPYQLVD